MRTLLSILVTMICLIQPATAETAMLTVRGESVKVPLPGSLKNVSEQSNMPNHTLLLETRAIEPWEKAGEFSDGMLMIGWAYKATDEAVQQERFDAMAKALGKGLVAKSKGKSYTPTSPAVPKDVYTEILSRLGRGGVGNVTMVEDTPRKKSFAFDGAFEMPGVITFPLVEDVSLVRVQGKLIMFHTWRLADKPKVRAQMLRVSQKLRNAIVRANPS